MNGYNKVTTSECMENSTPFLDTMESSEEEESSDWLVAISLVLIGSFFAALGDNLVKFSYTLEQVKVSQGQKPTPIYMRPFWSLGMFSIIILNSTFTLWSYSLADASIIIPFTGVRIIINMVFAQMINKEVFSTLQVGYTLVILFGISVVVLTGNHKAQEYQIHDFEHLFTKLPFTLISFMTFFSLFSFASVYVTTRSPEIKCLNISIISGIFASITQLFAKIVSETHGIMSSNTNQHSNATALLLIYLSVTTLFGSLHLLTLNHALKFFNAFVISPYLNATLIIFGTFYTSIYFEEWKRLSSTQLIGFPLGVLIASGGVLALAFSSEADMPQNTKLRRLSIEKSILHHAPVTAL